MRGNRTMSIRFDDFSFYHVDTAYLQYLNCIDSEVAFTQEKDYTKDSWKQLVEALTQAKEVSAKEDATKEEINEAIFNLEKTMNALKKVDSSTKDDNTSKGNTSSKDNQVITSTTKNDKKQSSTAKTGDETNIILFVLMAFMSWLGIKKVKKEEL